jgi:hypothetical protein
VVIEARVRGVEDGERLINGYSVIVRQEKEVLLYHSTVGVTIGKNYVLYILKSYK